MSRDKDYRKMISSSQWLKLRRVILTEHPLCERCQADGLIAAATEVHHRRPVESGINREEMRRLMFNPDNLAALCHRCHVVVHIEMGRSGKVATRQRNNDKVAAIINKFFG